jgi:hypothetical protein
VNDLDSMPIEAKWEMVMACLKEAESAAVWSFWRERFNTNHPDHIRREEVENPTRYAMANFFAAKAVYCDNKEAFDKLYEQKHKGSKFGELFLAMRQVIDKEMEEQLEKQVLSKE